MSLTLHYHPLSSFCHKALIALYENEVPFTPHRVDLGDAAQRASFRRLWPMGKFPVLQDEGRGVIVAESTIIIEYLDRVYPGPSRLIPED
ncbi:MAG: glutathione S-transferase family protein, partial [Pseudoxanthomonas sp.]